MSNGAFSAGDSSSNGGIYRKLFSYQGDQIVQTDTCLLDESLAQTEQFTYDQLERLTQATRPAGNFADAGGAFNSQIFSYNSLGERSGETLEGATVTETPPSGGVFPHRLAQRQYASPFINGNTYAYDRDGHVTTKYGPRYPDGTGQYASTLSLSYGTTSTATAGDVVRFATVDGATYSYWYDALNRRFEKDYPGGAKDRYFYTLDNQLMVDVGNDDPMSPTRHPFDEYVYLGGRPVLMVRGQMSFSGALSQETRFPGEDCSTLPERGATVAHCGISFPITDNVGKPLLQTAFDARVDGLGEYQPFGYQNRVEMNAESLHPYAIGSTMTAASTPVATYVQAVQVGPSNNFGLQMRPRLDLVDGRYGGWCPNDYIDTVNWGNLTGYHAGTFLGIFSGATYSAPLAMAATCQAIYSGGVCSCPSPATTNTFAGVVMGSYEYRKVYASLLLWNPLRFAGQYYDAETALSQNWNRFYDPSIGRYLEPEPELQDPKNIVKTAKTGSSMPAYAYAQNNPLSKGDFNGLDVFKIVDPSPATPLGGHHWSVAFTTECSNTCEADPVVEVISYECEGRGLDCVFSQARPHVVDPKRPAHLKDVGKGDQVFRCEADCEATKAAFEAAKESCKDPYNVVTHNCQDVVQAALNAANCSQLTQE